MTELLILALGGLNLLVGLYSLSGSLRYRRNAPGVDRSRRKATYQPATILFVPFCGEEEGLAENVRALCRLDYPQLELVFILESDQDRALPVIRRIVTDENRAPKLVLAGPAAGRGQKVHNLLAGLNHHQEAEILAFADSDGRPDPGWLARLVEPLEKRQIGLSSGYRFYIPERRDPGSVARSVWNAGVLTLLGDHERNFAWGGSMAIRRDVFRVAGIESAWQGALSDDYAMTRAVRQAGYRIEFVPTCLVGSTGTIPLGELLRWCARQMTITRIYWPAIWWLAGASQLLFVLFLVLGAGAAFAGDVGAGILLGAVLFLAGLGGWLRSGALEGLMPEWWTRVKPYRWAYVVLPPIASVITLYGLFHSALTRQIEWRGKIYEMRSPTETVILPKGGP